MGWVKANNQRHYILDGNWTCYEAAIPQSSCWTCSHALSIIYYGFKFDLEQPLKAKQLNIKRHILSYIHVHVIHTRIRVTLHIWGHTYWCIGYYRHMNICIICMGILSFIAVIKLCIAYFARREKPTRLKIFKNWPKTIWQKPLKSRRAVFTRHTKNTAYVIGRYTHMCAEKCLLLFYFPQSLLDAYTHTHTHTQARPLIHTDSLKTWRHIKFCFSVRGISLFHLQWDAIWRA